MAAKHPAHHKVRSALAEADEPPVVSPLVLAEVDYMLASRLGAAGSLQAIDALTNGGFEIPTIGEEDLLAARPLLAKYADLNIGLTDAINVILADRYRTDSILTLDHRHFRVIRPLHGQIPSFRLIPADLA
ncbi:PIN domain-containing protein [Sphaerimonospora cavernae]|uniref:PIN domain-containing protein n=1 Tax=Sphaerimonospora cavernae TaxID=1740611 RepID=A0ABV6TYQ5_9ACTN